MSATITALESKARSKGVVLKLPEPTMEVRRELFRITFPLDRQVRGGEPHSGGQPHAEPKRILVLADTALNGASFTRVWIDGVDLASPFVRQFWNGIDALYEPVKVDSVDDFVEKHRAQLDLVSRVPGALGHSGLVLLRASDLLSASPSLAPEDALSLQIAESMRIRATCERIDLQVRGAIGRDASDFAMRGGAPIFPVSL